MRSVGRKRGKAKLDLPMTPMIDMIFSLLVFFLLTPSFRVQEAYLTTNLPRSEGPVAGKPQLFVERLTINLFSVPLDESDNKYRGVSVTMDDQPFGADFYALEARLREYEPRLPPDHPVLIAPDMGVRYKWVVQAFDAAVAARFKNIQFAVPR